MSAKKIRILVFALIFSGALNIAFLVDFILQKSPISLAKTAENYARIETSNGKILAAMSRLSFRELVSFLTNRDLVEEGCTKRDLALSALVHYHHFNLEKALSGKPEQVRTVMLSNSEIIDIFPGVKEEEYEAIIRFAYQEKWPLTARGLFIQLQNKEAQDESLERAFFHTPEFYALQVLFQKTKSPQDPEVLLKLCLEGDFDLLEKFAREQSQILDFSEEKRRALLLEYLCSHSQTAATLLLRTDFAFALKRLEDKEILNLLALLKKPSEESEKFCLELLRSLRGDAIRHAAAMTLYSHAGEIPIQPVDPKAVLARFSKEPLAEFAPAPTACYHVVKEGDNLWKIARQYKVKVEEIVKLNEMQRDSLFPGMTLKLPQGTGSEPPR